MQDRVGELREGINSTPIDSNLERALPLSTEENLKLGFLLFPLILEGILFYSIGSYFGCKKRKPSDFLQYSVSNCFHFSFLEGILVTTTVKLKDKADLKTNVQPYLQRMVEATKREEGNFSASCFKREDKANSLFLLFSFVSVLHWKRHLQKSYLHAANMKIKTQAEEIQVEKWSLLI